jgi:hypothetical protein
MKWGSASFQRFSKWMFVSTVFGSCQHVLSTDAMLTMLALMNEERTLNFIGKDIVGQLSSLAVMMGLTKHIDSDPRKFMFQSQFLYQTSMSLMLLAPACSTYFLPIAGLGNMLGNVAFMGFGGINAKCIQALATDNNVGELYSKLTITQTLASSIGMSLGVALSTAPSVPGSELWFVALGVGNVFCYYKAVTNVIK